MNQDEFRDKIARICENLARSEAEFHMWTYKPNKYQGFNVTDGNLRFNVYLLAANRSDRTDGFRISLDDEGFQGVYQNDLEIPAIGVSANKKENLIAADIAKRFIPGARLAYTELLKRKAEHEAYLAKVQANKAAILGINPELFYYDERLQRNHDKTEVQIDAKGIYGSVRVTGTGIRFEAFSVSFEQGKIMLQALSRAIKSQEHQKIVLDLIKAFGGEIGLDTLEAETSETFQADKKMGMRRAELHSAILDLELSNTIRQLPGKRFKIVELKETFTCIGCCNEFEYSKEDIAQGYTIMPGVALPAGKVPIRLTQDGNFACASCYDQERDGGK